MEFCSINCCLEYSETTTQSIFESACAKRTQAEQRVILETKTKTKSKDKDKKNSEKKINFISNI